MLLSTPDGILAVIVILRMPATPARGMPKKCNFTEI